MQRRTFVMSAGMAILGGALPGAALARTRGVVAPADTETIRVLLATGSAFPTPQRLDGSQFAWNGRRYRGSFALITLENGERALVDSVPLDDYLYGVLGAEVSSDWPAVALQTQAIVSRTYALTNLHRDREYDVTANVSDQRYRGVTGESAEGRAAVDATAGRFVSFAGAPAHVAYSACCGGCTADSQDVWDTAYPYLRSRVDPHCAGTPDYRWEARVPYSSVAQALGLGRVGQLCRVELHDLDPSGRPRLALFDGSLGQVEVATRDLRAAAGLNVVWSTFLRGVDVERGSEPGLAIVGNGRGHGVGLCQWGARMMAENGARIEDILALYFPTTALGRV